MTIDALIVLGGGIKENGSLSLTTEKRVKKAVEIYPHIRPKGIIMSGRWSLLYTFTPTETEANAAKKLATKLGIPFSKILTENRSMETVGNAYFVKKLILEPHNWTRLMIVTSDFHRKRAMYAFKKVLGPTYELCATTVRSNLNPVQRLKRWIGENKLLIVYQQWLTPITDGNDVEIKNLLDQLPGYNANPTYATEQLIQIIEEA